jgi:hypothetical protein
VGKSKIARIDDFLRTSAKLLHRNYSIQQLRWRKETFMSNMSDCRFRHIVTDLSDCEDAIDELFNGVTDDGQPKVLDFGVARALDVADAHYGRHRVGCEVTSIQGSERAQLALKAALEEAGGSAHERGLPLAS